MSKPEKPEFGTFLEWNAIEKHAKYLHDLSVQHLIQAWPALSSRIGDPSTWGDEIEYQILGFDSENSEVNLVMKQDAVLEKLSWSNLGIDIQPEYAKYMVESAPSEPYNGSGALSLVYKSLVERREIIDSALSSNESVFTLSLFPLLHVSELSKALNASFEDDTAVLKQAVARVGRYQTLHQNLTDRSTREYQAEVPVFLDTNTRKALDEAALDMKDIENEPNKQPVIHLEDIIFAMGGCGLQVTFQTETLDDVRKLHDQLSILGPILLALTAATPIYKGMLADSDTRWNQACSMVDDRTPEEMARLPTRWSTSPMYLSKDIHSREHLSSPELLPRDKQIEEQLGNSGFDSIMALYFANLHLRDPLVLRGQESSIMSMSAADVHQSICGSVWAHVRLKVPRAELPDGVKPEEEGWRVEFRPMEVQPTDFANASFLVFMQLLRQVLMDVDLDLYMPLDLVRDNMNRAHTRNAVLKEKCWFPRNPYPRERQREDLVLTTIDEIINGSKGLADGSGEQSSPSSSSKPFEGLIALIRNNIKPELREEVEEHLEFVSKRASGLEKTPASWQRDFVQNHPDYAHDSIVTPHIAYDMLTKIRQMNE